MHIYVPGNTQKTTYRNKLCLILDVAISMTVIRKEEYVMQWVLSTSSVIVLWILSDIKFQISQIFSFDLESSRADTISAGHKRE